jgi:hypothetical protein
MRDMIGTAMAVVGFGGFSTPGDYTAPLCNPGPALPCQYPLPRVWNVG